MPRQSGKGECIAESIGWRKRPALKPPSVQRFCGCGRPISQNKERCAACAQKGGPIET